MSNKLKPLQDFVLIKRHEATTTTLSGILIPDTASEKPDQGEVLAVGPGRKVEKEILPMSVGVGDTVLFAKHTGQAVKIDGLELLMIRESDLIAVLE